MDILTDYKDYNTALALVCLGYNEKAYNLIATLGRSANNYYLGAILSVRLGNEQQAIELLKQACEMDKSKWIRADKEPELKILKLKIKF